jgi:hypothetical protein
MNGSRSNRFGSGWALFNAVGWALLFHLLLFTAVRPASDRSGNERVRMTVPETRYAARSVLEGLAGVDARQMWSPVLFSLPSALGFSRELMEKEIDFRLSYEPEASHESFLRVEYVDLQRDVTILANPERITDGFGGPGLPATGEVTVYRAQQAPRTYVDPRLARRLGSPLLLPELLNQRTAKNWEVQAEVSVDPDGTIQHIFLRKPVADGALNRAVLQTLYGLRFEPGDAMTGVVEIYSNPAEGSQP